MSEEISICEICGAEVNEREHHEVQLTIGSIIGERRDKVIKVYKLMPTEICAACYIPLISVANEQKMSTV